MTNDVRIYPSERRAREAAQALRTAIGYPARVLTGWAVQCPPIKRTTEPRFLRTDGTVR